jgi:hypothetical protein
MAKARPPSGTPQVDNRPNDPRDRKRQPNARAGESETLFPYAVTGRYRWARSRKPWFR